MVTCKTIQFDDPQWNNLVQLSQTATFFQQQEWLQLWIQHFPIGHELVGVYEDEKLIGIIPFSYDGEKIYLLGTTPVLGGEQVCDFGDIISLPSKEKIVWENSMSYISKKYPGKSIQINYVRENSPSYTILNALTNNVSETATSPFLNLPSSWEDYLSTLDKKDRHELQRKMRRLTKSSYNVHQEEPTNENIALFISLMKLSAPEKDRFLSVPMEHYFHDLLFNTNREQLILWFLDIEGKTVAAVVSFKFKEELLLYNSGMDINYRQLSVGLLSKALLIKHSIELGLKQFNFLQGNEPYKYDLGAADNKLYQFIITV